MYWWRAPPVQAQLDPRTILSRHLSNRNHSRLAYIDPPEPTVVPPVPSPRLLQSHDRLQGLIFTTGEGTKVHGQRVARLDVGGEEDGIFGKSVKSG